MAKLEKQIFTIKKMSKEINQPVMRSINRTATHLMSIAAREVVKNYTIKVGDAKKMMKIVKKSTAGGLETVIRAESRLLTPYHFKYTPTTGITTKPGTGWKNYKKRPITTVTIKKGSKKQLNHSFVAIVKGVRNVYYRKGKTIVSLRSVSLPQMVGNPKVANVINQDMDTFFTKNFLHEFNYQADKVGWK